MKNAPPKDDLPSNSIEALDLNLPVAPTWFSQPPFATYDEMIASCERQLPYWNERRMKSGDWGPPPSSHEFTLPEFEF